MRSWCTQLSGEVGAAACSSHAQWSSGAGLPLEESGDRRNHVALRRFWIVSVARCAWYALNTDMKDGHIEIHRAENHQQVAWYTCRTRPPTCAAPRCTHV